MGARHDKRVDLVNSVLYTEEEMLDGVTKNQQKPKPVVDNRTDKQKYLDTVLKEGNNAIEGYFAKYEEVKNEFYRRFCNKHRFNKLLFNLRLRINEGMMINHSLAKLRKDIKSVLLNSVSLETSTGDVFLPIVYDNSISPVIRNTYLEDNFFENFITSNTRKQPIEGKIMDLIQNFGVNIDNMHIAIFTVINLTDSEDKPINNPPTPPYINLSTLIYHLPQKEANGMSRVADVNKIIEVFKDTMNFATRYDFYKTNDALTEIRSKSDDELKKFIVTKGGKEIYQLTNTQDFITTIYEPFIESFIELVQQNNPSSLIGSLESTDMLRSFTHNKIIGFYNNTINKNVFSKYKSIGLEYYNKQFMDQKDKKINVIMSDEEFAKNVAAEISG
jgi:hypothetical protein